jgi:hypothetical protein
MSERDLPQRLEPYGANVDLRRIALTLDDVRDLPSFPARSKRKDPRHDWFLNIYGDRCWELDAMPANRLRARVRDSIVKLIDKAAWSRCAHIEKAERASIEKVWAKVFSDRYQKTRGGSP